MIEPVSFFQPLITSAFATYSVRKPSYIEQRSAVSDPQDTDGRVAATDRVSAVQETEKTQQSEKVRDDGKPRSLSGDVLDLSSDYQKSYADENVDKTAESPDKSAELTPEEQQQVQELKARDSEVRIHEQAHLATAGAYATGGPTFTYQTGPDGKRYAIGGEVSIDTSGISGDPEATIQKMQTIAAAALAPAEPSGQDQKVAAAARQKEAQARAELASQRSESSNSSEESGEVENSQDGTVKTAQENHSEETAESKNQKFGDKTFGAAYRSQSSVFSAKSANTVRFSAFV